MGLIKMMWSDGPIGKTFAILLLLLIVSFPLAIYGAIIEAREWEKFKISQNCKIVGHERGHSSTGVGVGMTASGQMGTVITTNTTPDKTGWLCDDGVTYWR